MFALTGPQKAVLDALPGQVLDEDSQGLAAVPIANMRGPDLLVALREFRIEARCSLIEVDCRRCWNSSAEGQELTALFRSRPEPRHGEGTTLLPGGAYRIGAQFWHGLGVIDPWSHTIIVTEVRQRNPATRRTGCTAVRWSIEGLTLARGPAWRSRAPGPPRQISMETASLETWIRECPATNYKEAFKLLRAEVGDKAPNREEVFLPAWNALKGSRGRGRPKKTAA